MSPPEATLLGHLPGGAVLEAGLDSAQTALRRELLAPLDPASQRLTLTSEQAVAIAQAGLVEAVHCPGCGGRKARTHALQSVVFVVEVPSPAGRRVEVRCTRSHVLASLDAPLPPTQD